MFDCSAACFALVDGVMQFQCEECGTCDIVYTPGSVKWNNPHGCFGGKDRFG